MWLTQKTKITFAVMKLKLRSFREFSSLENLFILQFSIHGQILDAEKNTLYFDIFSNNIFIFFMYSFNIHGGWGFSISPFPMHMPLRIYYNWTKWNCCYIWCRDLTGRQIENLIWPKIRRLLLVLDRTNQDKEKRMVPPSDPTVKTIWHWNNT